MQRNLLDGVVAFVAVAQRRSFTAAAAELGVTPAAVSWTIKQLEAKAGVALLTRTTRDVGLTEAGQAFLEHARTGVAEIATGFDRVQALGARPAGRLRITAAVVTAQSLLAPLIPEFCEAYPEIELELYMDDRFTNLVEEGFDAGIRLGEAVEADMAAVPLTRATRFIVVGAPAYFDARGRPERPEDLKDHACINYRQTHRGGIYRWEFEEDGREFEMAVSGPLIVNNGQLMLAAAVSGVGLAYTTDQIAGALIEQGLLETVLDSFSPTGPGLYLYFPSRAQVMPKLRAFIDFVTARL
jgi:DNA-binding transcriptional LysR family regulator